MKSLLLLFLFSAIARANDFRLVGTNLYDFSTAGQIFHIRGVIVHYYSNSTKIFVYAHQYRIGPPIDSHTGERIGYMLEGDDLDRFVAAYHLKSQTGQLGLLTENEFLSLDADTQKFYSPVYTAIYLLNYPTPGNPPATEGIESKINDSQLIDCLAVPTAIKGFYDCGKPFTGDTNQFSTVHIVLRDRIIIRTNSAINFSMSPTNTSATITNSLK